MFKKKNRKIIGHPRVSHWFLLIVLLGQISMSVIRLTSELYTRLIDLTGNENLFWGFPFFEWSYRLVCRMAPKGILVSDITAVILCLLLAILIYQIRCQINALLALTSLLILGLSDITLTVVAFFTNTSVGITAVASVFNSRITFILMIVYLSQTLIGIWGIWLFTRLFITKMAFKPIAFSKRHLYLIINLWGLILSNYLELRSPSEPTFNLFYFITLFFIFDLMIGVFINLKTAQTVRQKDYLILLLVLLVGLPLQRYHFQFSNVLIIITLAQYLIKSRQISANEKASNS